MVEKPQKIKPKLKKEKQKKEKVSKVKKTASLKVVPLVPKERYFEATGRRKTAIARVRIFNQGEKSFLVNGKSIEAYFPTLETQKICQAALELMKLSDQFKVSVKVSGGGFNSQAEAVRHGITRALILFNPAFRKRLKKAGYLKRDPRMRERKKFGLKRARRAPQWKKR